MKILYIGHYRENSGWGQAARDYIKALEAAISEYNESEIEKTVPDFICLVCRPVILAGGHPATEFKKYEDNTTQDVDYCIQHILPHHMVPTDKFKKNVGLFVTETDVCFEAWDARLRLMDELWVPNKEMEVWFTTFNHLGPQVKVVNHATDKDKFKKDYPKLQVSELDCTYKFYFIGEFTRRKNIAAMLEAFHTEFNPNEPVSLIIKTSVPGKDAKEAQQIVQSYISKVKKSLNLYPRESDYHRELVITDRLSDEQIYGLHKYGDCCVAPSFGEAWDIPAFDAMGFGKHPICSKVGGHNEYINQKDSFSGMLIPTHTDIVTAVESPIPGLFTGRETWQAIDKIELKKAMRYYYNVQNKPEIQDVGKYSYMSIGRQMLKALQE